MIKLMIVDDQVILKESLKFIFSQDPDLEVVCTAENGSEAIELAKLFVPDVILMDIKMPILDGVEATRQIKAHQADIKIIVLTTFLEEAYIVDAMRFGASGYLLKDALPEEIRKAIFTVSEGGTYMNPTAATKLVDRFSKAMSTESQRDTEGLKDLTDRELDILKCIAEGLSNDEIAKRLFLTEGTVKNHLTKVLLKLNLRDRTQLAIFAIRAGL